MLKKKYSPEELQKAREEAERKARRGEIEPTHDFTFTLIGQAGPRSLVERKKLTICRFSSMASSNCLSWSLSSRIRQF